MKDKSSLSLLTCLQSVPSPARLVAALQPVVVAAAGGSRAVSDVGSSLIRCRYQSVCAASREAMLRAAAAHLAIQTPAQGPLRDDSI